MRAPLTMIAGSLLGVLLAGCGGAAGSASCGIEALTGPLAVKQSFAEGHALTEVPSVAPSGLPVRLVAGPAWHATVAGDSANRWRVTVHGTVAPEAHIGYGVLVVDYHNASLGVLAFDGQTVRGASNLGVLVVGDSTVPLLGVRLEPGAIQSARCPVFPDSLR